jgi:hypothetical protein
MSVAVHPLYRDEAKVKELSEWFLSGGHSVFQMFQFCGNEKAHSEFLLEARNGCCHWGAG